MTQNGIANDLCAREVFMSSPQIRLGGPYYVLQVHNRTRAVDKPCSY